MTDIENLRLIKVFYVTVRIETFNSIFKIFLLVILFSGQNFYQQHHINCFSTFSLP